MKWKIIKSKYCRCMLCLTLALTTLLSGCGAEKEPPPDTEALYQQAVELAAGRGQTDYGIITAGQRHAECDRASIDWSGCEDGYVTVTCAASADKKLKVQIKGPEVTPSYTLLPGETAVLPLSEGSGTYQIAVLENAGDSRYALILSQEITVELTDAFAPYLRPNQYVNYADAPVAVALAGLLTGGKETEMEQIAAVFSFVTTHLSYDREQAATVQAGYVPDLDDVLARKSGICFDYASLMAAMLRCSGIPCRLVTGYAGTEYHAWLNIWSETDGWLEAVIYFDGSGWQRVDPTFADADATEKEIKDALANTAYTEKYYY